MNTPRVVLRLFLAALGATLSVASCGPGSSSGSGGGSSGSSGSTGSSSGSEDVAPGAPGAACSTDADCPSGRCLGTLAPGPVKYCSPRCSSSADCSVFAKNGGGFRIGLPGNLQGSNNSWASSALERGAGCLPVPAELGASDGNDYCLFACPSNAAEIFSGGNVTACGCLPNFHNVGSKTDLDCQWNASVQCSLFTPCIVDPCQAQGPCAQNVSCVVGQRLEGQCFSMTTNIEGCVLSQQGSCNGACLANNCTGTQISPDGTDPCVAMCCSSGSSGGGCSSSSSGSSSGSGSSSSSGTSSSSSSGGCPSGETSCGGKCVNLANDASNCGSCGHVCGNKESCSSSACSCTMAVADAVHCPSDAGVLYECATSACMAGGTCWHAAIDCNSQVLCSDGCHACSGACGAVYNCTTKQCQ